LRRPRGEAADTGGDVVRISHPDRDVAEAETEARRDDLRERRLVPLAVGAGAGPHDAAVGGQLDLRVLAGCVGVRDLHVHGDADAKEQRVVLGVTSRLLAPQPGVAARSEHVVEQPPIVT
jgi:hypothetical protein